MKKGISIVLFLSLLLAGIQPACKKADPTKVAIKNFTVSQIPMVKPDGSSWEDLPLIEGGPDVYWLLTDENDSVYYGSRNIRFDRVTKEHLPLIRGISPPLELGTLSRNYYLKIWDWDLIGGDDLMATMGPFSFSKYMKDKPDEITLSGDSAIVIMAVEWRD